MMESSHAFRMKNNLVAPGARLNADLTDEQKADMKKMAEQRLSLQKENLSRLVTAGQITQAQADAKIQWMQERINAAPEQGCRRTGNGDVAAAEWVDPASSSILGILRLNRRFHINSPAEH